MKKKLILAFLFVMFVFGIICQTKSYGYELIYKVKPYVAGGGAVEDHIYRTYTTAHPDTVANFPTWSKEPWYDSNFGWVDWAYVPGDTDPSTTSFVTTSLRFHKEIIGSYSAGGNSGYGYTSGLVTEPSVLAIPSDIVHSYVIGTLGNGRADYEDNSSDNILVATPTSQQQKMTLLASGSGEGYKDGYTPYINANNPTGADISKVYVTDHYITWDQLNQMVGFAASNNNRVYVSNVTETKYGKNSNGVLAGPYLRGVELGSLLLHYSAKSLIDSKYWSTGSEKGQNTEDRYRLGSAINLYDNTLVFPQQGKRTVVVRHLDIDTNQEISTEIVNAAVERDTFEGNSQATVVKADGTTRAVASDTSLYPEFQEVYAGSISADEKVNIGVLQTTDYECKGYNIDMNPSFETARDSRNLKVQNREMIPIGNATQVTAEAGNSSVDDFVFVDLYYSKRVKPPRTILVRYIDIGTNNTISTNIVSRSSFIPVAAASQRTLSSGVTLTSQNSLYPEFQEVWVIPENETMTITARSMTATGYTYRGYIAAGDSNASYETAFYNSLRGRNEKIASGVYDSTSANKVLDARTGENQYKYMFGMIDFYYSSPTPSVRLQLQPLLGTIMYSRGNNSPFANSGDEAIVPSGEQITVGDAGAYKYMLGGIEIRRNEIYQDRTYTISHNVTGTGTYKYTYWYDDHQTYSTNPGSTTYHTEDVSATCGEGQTPPCTKRESVAHTVYSAIAEDTPDIPEKTGKKEYTYRVPVKYTYYTVPNMKVFTANKLDIYNKNGTADSKGLPFLYKSGISDNSNYTLYPTNSYNSSVQTRITNISGNTISNSSVLNRTNYEYVNRTGGDTWTDTIDIGTYSEYSSLSKSDAEAKAEEELQRRVNLQINDQTNRSVATAIDSRVTFQLQNTDISIDGTNITDANRITRTIELANFNENGFNYGGYGKPSGASYKDTTYNSNNITRVSATEDVNVITDSNVSNNKTYLDYATADTSEDKVSGHYYPSFSKTSINDWASNVFNVPTLRLNGNRLITAKITYTLDSRNTIGGDSFTDTEWKNVSSSDNISGNTLVDGPKTGAFIDRTLLYKGAGTGEGEVQVATVFTPIAPTGRVESADTALIDHTSTGTLGENVIQKNSMFKIVCLPNAHTYYGGLNSSKIDGYIKSYYVKLDFDVENVRIGYSLYRSGRIVPAGTWIGPISKSLNYITAQAVRSPDTANQNAVFAAEQNKIWVMAIATNGPTSFANLAADIASGALAESRFVDQPENILGGSIGFATIAIRNKYHGRSDIDNISNYAAKSDEITTTNLSRLFDFKVTDLKDVGWKSVFRKTEGNNTNVHTGNVYYSGATRWNFYSLKLNEILTRTSSEVGTNPKRILPLGPYKNTNIGYIKAPKIGYRFSFDLKTTGKIVNATTTNRQVEITPSFYYISKDTTKFLMADQIINNKKIKLFYKNSSGRYVEIGSTQDTYMVSFTPKDGYRHLETNLYGYSSSTLSTSSLQLGSLKRLTITRNMMATSNNNFIQTWYGEYKLPNSTIAVEVVKDSTGKETYDINKPLKDGYIGVVFNIEATVSENRAIKLKYNVGNKDGNSTNTSQWDYEGYLGFVRQGNTLNNGEVKLKLEKGIWSLNNTIYNQIKGTVILYDTDNRAADDFQ